MDSKDRIRGGTWHRYKLGQAQFTRWLKQTADKITPNGDDARADSRPEASTSAKRSKKKAASAGVNGDVAVHWRDLELMASSIVENAQPEDIPPAPINILRDVIGLRKKSARFFRRRADEDEEARDRNATHEHIIQVLERVLAKFEAVRARVQRPGGDAARSANAIGLDLNDLNNMFEHLEVQASAEGAEDDEVMSDVENKPEPSSARKSTAKAKKGGKKKPQKGAKAKKQRPAVPSTAANGEEQDSAWIDDVDFGLEGEAEDEQFDYFMLIYCFFEDFNLVRSYVCERWCDYYFDRSIDLNTLAVITNASFELFHQMEHDLLLDLRRLGYRDPNMGQYEFMMMNIFVESGMEHIEYDVYEDLSEEESNERIYKDEWDWLASPAFSSIQTLLRYIPPGKTAMLKKSDRTPPVYGGTTAHELNRFKDAVISDLLFDVVCVKALKKNGGAPEILPAESELLLGFQDALRNYDWSSAFIFSLQLYIDIRYILEDTVSHPFQNLQKTVSRIDRDLPLQMEWASGPRHEVRRSLRQRQREVERYMMHDVVLEDKLPRYMNSGLEREDVEDFYLLRHEPVWAGLLDFRAKLVFNELGHELVHRSFLVEAAAYLYAAARAASAHFPDLLLGDEQVFPAWIDMDRFLDSYADDSPFKHGLLSGGDDGNDPVAILRRFAEIAPASPADPKPEARNTALDAAPGQTEAFRRAVRIRAHLLRRYGSEERGGQFFMQYTQGLIQERLAPELEGVTGAHGGSPREEEEEIGDVAAVLREIGSSRPSARPHAAGTLSGERRAAAEERVELRDRQRAARQRAVLARLSPVQQVQILEDTVAAQLREGLLSIDFMELFRTSKEVLAAVGMGQGEEFQARAGFRSGPESTRDDQMVRVPVLLGELLAGDSAKEEEVLRTLVNDVKATVAKGVEDALDEECRDDEVHKDTSDDE